MKTTTISRHHLRENMIMLLGQDKFYIIELDHNNDDSTLIRGSYQSFEAEPSASIIMWDNDRVKIVIGE